VEYRPLSDNELTAIYTPYGPSRLRHVFEQARRANGLIQALRESIAMGSVVDVEVEAAMLRYLGEGEHGLQSNR
jgi:hypothetical protein